MKISDKLLLILLLSILGAFGIVHLTLYARLKNGHVFRSPRPTTGWTTAYKGAAPPTLTLVGNINVSIVQSDSFYVEVQEEGAGKIKCHLEQGDSLVVAADSTFPISPHGMFQAYGDFSWVSVHTGRHTRIQLRKLLALVKGSARPGGTTLDIKASDTQLWLGETYGMEGANYPTEYYDSIHVQAESSNLLLLGNAAIGKLSVRLDDQSELNDQHPKALGSLHLEYAPQSKLNLSGATLDKLIK